MYNYNLRNSQVMCLHYMIILFRKIMKLFAHVNEWFHSILGVYFVNCPNKCDIVNCLGWLECKAWRRIGFRHSGYKHAVHWSLYNDVYRSACNIGSHALHFGDEHLYLLVEKMWGQVAGTWNKNRECGSDKIITKLTKVCSWWLYRAFKSN